MMIPDFEPCEAAEAEERQAYRRSLWVVVGTLVMAFIALLIFAFFTGCAALPSPTDAEVVAEYEGRQLACVAEAGTREEADRCRCAVKAAYHRDCYYDGGR